MFSNVIITYFLIYKYLSLHKLKHDGSFTKNFGDADSKYIYFWLWRVEVFFSHNRTLIHTDRPTDINILESTDCTAFYFTLKPFAEEAKSEYVWLWV